MKKDFFLTLGAILLAAFMIVVAGGISSQQTSAEEMAPSPSPTNTIAPVTDSATGCCYVRYRSGEIYYADEVRAGFFDSTMVSMSRKRCDEYAGPPDRKADVAVRYFFPGMKCPSIKAGACAPMGSTKPEIQLLDATGTGETQAKAHADCIAKLEPSLKCPTGCDRYLSGPPTITSAKQTKTRAVDGKDEWEAKCQAVASCRKTGTTGQ